jgi:Flp pilus assembly protein TadD
VELLLKTNLDQAHRLALETYSRSSTNASPDATIAATYAYSLHLQGRTSEGLAVLKKLPPDTLDRSPIALYYGLLLAASGNTNEAAKFLDIAGSAKLLPEEKTLLLGVR